MRQSVGALDARLIAIPTRELLVYKEIVSWAVRNPLLEIADQFLLGVDGDDRLLLGQRGLRHLVDVTKLGISIPMALPFAGLAIALRLKFSPRSSPYRVADRMPLFAQLRESRRRLLHVQRSGVSGSPRSVGSTKASSAWTRPPSCSVSDLRPPPDRRTCSSGASKPEASSSSPRPIVLGAIPVAGTSPLCRHTRRPRLRRREHAATSFIK